MIHIKFFEFQFIFIDNNISEHTDSFLLLFSSSSFKYISTFFHELCAALSAGDGNLSPALGYSYLLLTVGTLVDSVILALGKFVLLAVPGALYLHLPLIKLLVFQGAFVSLSGKHAEIGIYHYCKRQQIENINAEH